MSPFVQKGTRLEQRAMKTTLRGGEFTRLDLLDHSESVSHELRLKRKLWVSNPVGFWCCQHPLCLTGLPGDEVTCGRETQGAASGTWTVMCAMEPGGPTVTLLPRAGQRLILSEKLQIRKGKTERLE